MGIGTGGFPTEAGFLPYVKIASDHLTASDPSFVAAVVGATVVVLSVAWVAKTGTQSIQFTGATSFPAMPLSTTDSGLRRLDSNHGLLKSSVGGPIGVTIVGDSPDVDVTMAYVVVNLSDGRLAP